MTIPSITTNASSIRVYSWGTRPDTLLNIRVEKGDCYLEITNNGRLNVKARLTDTAAGLRREVAGSMTKYWRDRLDAFEITPSRRRSGKTTTLFSIDVGIGLQKGRFVVNDFDRVARNIDRVLGVFSQSCASAPLAPRS